MLSVTEVYNIVRRLLTLASPVRHEVISNYPLQTEGSLMQLRHIDVLLVFVGLVSHNDQHQDHVACDRVV